MDRKQFLKTLFSYGTAVAVAPSLLFSKNETVCRYPEFGFELLKPSGWVHLAIPRFEHLTERQRQEITNHDWFDWIRQVSGLPVALFSQNEAPWTSPTAMVAAYANPLSPEMPFEQFMNDAPQLFTKAFPNGQVLDDVRYRTFGSVRGGEFAIRYNVEKQIVRSRSVIAWGSKFEICLSLEDYPNDGCDAKREFGDVLDSLVVS